MLEWISKSNICNLCVINDARKLGHKYGYMDVDTKFEKVEDIFISLKLISITHQLLKKIIQY